MIMTHTAFREALTGPVPSVPVPFHEDGSIDYPGLRHFVDFVMAAGARSVMLTYGDSLYSALTDDEVVEVSRVVVEHVRGRAMTVVADRTWATPKAVEFARFARETGADMYMALPPDWALSCTQDSLVAHYAAVAKEIPVMVVTNYLMPRSREFSMGLLQRLVREAPGVVAVKDDLVGEFARHLGLTAHEHFALVSGGQKQNHLNALPYGCDGYLSTFMKFKPEIAQRYWSAITKNDLAAARAIVAKYDMPFFDFISKLPGGFDAGIHGTLELFGVVPRWRRKPYASLNDAGMERLAGFLGSLGLL